MDYTFYFTLHIGHTSIIAILCHMATFLAHHLSGFLVGVAKFIHTYGMIGWFKSRKKVKVRLRIDVEINK